MDISDVRKNFFYNQFDIDQQNAIRLQQIEAIKLIQISLDKLTSTTTVQLNPNSSSSSSSSSSSNNQKQNTVLVYKEANLHKNLLVNKILNKAKYIYYQGVIQTMRLSLMSKLNYYSNLIQQLNNSSSDETSLVDEMKLLMQQILHETYQFNLANQPAPVDLTNIFSQTTQTEPDTLDKSNNSNNNNNSNSNNSQTDQIKRIKQLNDLKVSLYSLLFNQTQHTESKPKTKRASQELEEDDEDDENLNVDDDVDDRMNKKCKITDECANGDVLDTKVDLNNNQILNDETNTKELNRRFNTNKKFKFKPKSTSSKILNIECLV